MAPQTAISKAVCYKTKNEQLGEKAVLFCTITQIYGELLGILYMKSGSQLPVSHFVAEREGFEPPDPLRSTVFKTAAFDHSAISPVLYRSGIYSRWS